MGKPKQKKILFICSKVSSTVSIKPRTGPQPQAGLEFYAFKNCHPPKASHRNYAVRDGTPVFYHIQRNRIYNDEQH
jgi:hypothetical protein